jgi:hypothetical protein
METEAWIPFPASVQSYPRISLTNQIILSYGALKMSCLIRVNYSKFKTTL